MTVEERERVLFERHLGGDDAALVELFNAHNHRLFVYCHKFVGSSQAAEDLTQELWERVARMRLEPQSIRNPGGFFVRMARNLALNYVRDRRKLTPLDDLDDTAHPPNDAHDRTEMDEIVELALQSLPVDYREVLILNAYSGYNHEEIAAMLGKSPQAIWKRASRAREKLRAAVVTLMSEQNIDGASVGDGGLRDAR